MSFLRLLLAEIAYRRLNFALGLVAVVAAATLFVAAPLLIRGYRQETDARLAEMEEKTQEATQVTDQKIAAAEDQTRRLMREMGFNLMIVHADTNMADFWADDFAGHDLPQEYIVRLAQSPKLEHVRHLVATLQKKIEWRKRRVLLVGYLAETPQQHFGDKKDREPMGLNIRPGEAYLGYELWQSFDLKVGDAIEVAGHKFTVARAQKERGGKQDIEIALHLADAQRVLGLPGRVNQIMALGCQCDAERLPTIRKELAAVLPDTKISEFESIAQARAEQRKLMSEQRQAIVAAGKEQRQLAAEKRAEMQTMLEKLTALALPLVVFVSSLWVALLAWSNVRERRVEIGLLRALGKSSLFIAGLFLGRAIALGIVGGGLGFLLGGLLAWQVTNRVGEPNLLAASFTAPPELLGWTLLGALLVCALAAYLPILWAVLQDPANVLREA